MSYWWSDWWTNQSEVFTFVFVLETSVASSHLLTSFIDVINWFSTNESIFLVNVIIVSQTVATVVAVETKTRTSSLGTVFQFLTKNMFLEFCNFVRQIVCHLTGRFGTGRFGTGWFGAGSFGTGCFGSTQWWTDYIGANGFRRLLRSWYICQFGTFGVWTGKFRTGGYGTGLFGTSGAKFNRWDADVSNTLPHLGWN